MSMTVSQIRANAEKNGYTLHESVTDERLSRIPAAMLGVQPERLTKAHDAQIDAPRSDVARWIADRCLIAPYDLGAPGDEVVALPKADRELHIVVLPSYRIVAVTTGAGESYDGESASPRAMRYTILAAQ